MVVLVSIEYDWIIWKSVITNMGTWNKFHGLESSFTYYNMRRNFI